MEEIGGLFLILVILSTFAEWVSERLFGPWAKGQVMILLSAGVGVLLCIVFHIDGMALMGLGQSYFNPIVGQIVTGLIVGGGSNTVHKFFKKIT